MHISDLNDLQGLAYRRRDLKNFVADTTRLDSLIVQVGSYRAMLDDAEPVATILAAAKAAAAAKIAEIEATLTEAGFAYD